MGSIPSRQTPGASCASTRRSAAARELHWGQQPGDVDLVPRPQGCGVTAPVSSNCRLIHPRGEVPSGGTGVARARPRDGLTPPCSEGLRGGWRPRGPPQGSASKAAAQSSPSTRDQSCKLKWVLVIRLVQSAGPCRGKPTDLPTKPPRVQPCCLPQTTQRESHRWLTMERLML